MKEPGRLQSMGSLRVGHDWAISLSLLHSCIGDGNDNPLQCSCLENPRDGDARWAVVYGIAQSDTTEALSSSSSIDPIIPYSTVLEALSPSQRRKNNLTFHVHCFTVYWLASYILNLSSVWNTPSNLWVFINSTYYWAHFKSQSCEHSEAAQG